jgi:hypothetical protein
LQSCDQAKSGRAAPCKAEKSAPCRHAKMHCAPRASEGPALSRENHHSANPGGIHKTGKGWNIPADLLVRVIGSNEPLQSGAVASMLSPTGTRRGIARTSAGLMCRRKR